VISTVRLLAQSKDKKANAIVKEMVIAMGGEKNYNATSFYSMGFCKQKTFLGQMDRRC
jgi:hypothetical protein